MSEIIINFAVVIAVVLMIYISLNLVTRWKSLDKRGKTNRQFSEYVIQWFFYLTVLLLIIVGVRDIFIN